MKYDFTSDVSRENTGSTKTNRDTVRNFLGLNYYDDTISMWIADMDFACSPHIINRLKERIDKLIFGYTGLTDEYYQSIISWYKRRYHAEIEKDWIVYSNGTVMAIKNVIRTYTNSGDEIIIQSPVYYPFSREILEAKRKISNSLLLKDENNNYSIDFADFEERCKTAKLFILCNPHNPTGNIWSKEEVQRLIDIANKYNVVVFSDEVHSDLIRVGKTVTSAISLENIENVIVATAVNKTFNLAGTHGTNLIIKNENLRNKINEYTGKVTMSPFTLESTIAGYNDSEEWLEELKIVIDENFAYVDKFLKEHIPNVKFNIPDGTYLAWLDFSACGIEEGELVRKIADEAHVILEGGSMFGDCANGFIRMNLACPHHVVVEVLNRIARMKL